MITKNRAARYGCSPTQLFDVLRNALKTRKPSIIYSRKCHSLSGLSSLGSGDGRVGVDDTVITAAM